MTFAAILFWCLAFWALFSRGPLYVYLPWLCLPFGAFATVDPSLSFGSTILPVTVAVVVFVVKTALDRESRQRMWQSATDWRGLGLFTIFAVYAAISAAVCPRLFEGRIGVLPLRMTVIDTIQPLAPATANFTQAAFAVLYWLFALAIFAHLRGEERERRVQTLVRAMFAGGAILIVTGLIDYLGGKDSLQFLRNGSYAVAGYTQIGNFGRITGAYSEASAFGGATVALGCLLYFSRSLLGEGVFKRYGAPAIVALLFFLAAAATSSTAYAGLAVAIACIGANAAYAVFSGRLHRNLIGMGMLALGLLGLVAALLFVPDIFTSPLQLLDQAVLQKSSTQSYAQRNYWTATGYQVFWESWGLGAGAGATRVSSWPAAIASNLGVVGIACMGGLIILACLRQPFDNGSAVRHVRTATRSLLAVVLTMGYFAATTLDPGFPLALVFGWGLANSNWRPRRMQRRAPRSVRRRSFARSPVSYPNGP